MLLKVATFRERDITKEKCDIFLKDLDHIGLYKHVNVFHFTVKIHENVWAAVWFVNVNTKVAIKLSVIML